MIDYNLYFHRQIELWGKDTQESLKSKKIAIIGCGGLGSTLALALGCSGVGEITLVDFDEVSLHNIHRQITFTVDDVGVNKAKATAELIKQKNPFVNLKVYECDFGKFKNSTDSNYDLILDATDNLEVRADIDRYSKEIDTPWIYASVEDFNGQVCFFEKSNFQTFSLKEHKVAGIATPIVMQIGSFQANLALRYLAKLPIKKDILHYIYYDKDGDFIIKKFKMPT